MATIFQPTTAPQKAVPYELLLKSFNSSPVKKSEYYDILPYLSSVSEHSKQRIEDIYKLDFTLFGYSFLQQMKSSDTSVKVKVGWILVELSSISAWADNSVVIHWHLIVMYRRYRYYVYIMRDAYLMITDQSCIIK